jgi:hypothetical protein
MGDTSLTGARTNKAFKRDVSHCQMGTRQFDGSMMHYANLQIIYLRRLFSDFILFNSELLSVLHCRAIAILSSCDIRIRC